jgi:hypothetical protein
MARSGSVGPDIRCTLHGLRYGLDGEPAGETPGGPLAPVGLAFANGLVFACEPAEAPPVPPAPAAALSARARDLGAPAVHTHEVAANWKVLVEQWLERAAGGDATEFELPEGDLADGWSGARYRALAGAAGGVPERASFVAPNQLVRATAAGLLVQQVVPLAPGRARLRTHFYGYASRTREERALIFVAARLLARRLAADLGLAESVQRGLESPGYVAEGVANAAPALAAFRQSIARLLPGGDAGDLT